MGKLQKILMEDVDRKVLVQECVQLVDGQVEAAKGPSGMVIRAGFKTFKAFKPGILAEVMDHLMEPLAGILDKHNDAFEADSAAQPQGIVAYMTSRADAVADDLMALTDATVELSGNKTVKKAYQAVCKVGRKNVVAAVPAMAELMKKYLDR